VIYLVAVAAAALAVGVPWLAAALAGRLRRR